MNVFVTVARGALLCAALGSSGHACDLRLIGMVELRQNLPAGEAPAGGLSGLDYDPATDRWLAVSDERTGSPRAYWLNIDYSATAVSRATVESLLPLTLPAGAVADIESVRLDPAGDRIWFASEGDAAKDAQPFVALVDREGRAPGAFPLADSFSYTGAGIGLRPNQAVESLALDPGGETVWTATEGPLFEDDPPADFTKDARVRLIEQRRSGEMIRQLVYALEPVAESLAGGKRAANGVAEILMLHPGRLLVVERAGAEFGPGEWRFAVRLFEADLACAEEVDIRPLAGLAVRPVGKRLCYDFAASGLRVDNIEGLAIGRTLPDGRRTLIAISDDNFSPHQTTQVWVFELLAASSPNPSPP